MQLAERGNLDTSCTNRVIAWGNEAFPSLKKRPSFRRGTTGSPANNVWGYNAEIPYWWRVTIQIWAVLLIGWSKFPSRHDQSEKNYPDVGSDTSSVSDGISPLAPPTSFRGKTKGSQTSPALTLKILFSSSDFIKLATTVPLPEAW